MKAIRRRWQCNAVVCYTLSRGCLGALSIMGTKLPGCPTSRILLPLYLPPCLLAYRCLTLPAFPMLPTSSWPPSLNTYRILHPIALPPPMSPSPQQVSFLLSCVLPSSSSSLWILSVQIWTHSAQPRWALGSDKSYSL